MLPVSVVNAVAASSGNKLLDEYAVSDQTQAAFCQVNRPEFPGE